MNRFTAPVKQVPGVTVDLSVIVLSSTINHKMGTYGAKFDHETKTEKLFDLQCRLIKEVFPKSEIILGVGKDYHKANRNLREKWFDSGIRMVENQLWQETSETETLRLAMNVCPTASRVLFVSGDVYFDKSALSFLDASQSSTTYYMDQNEDEIGLNFDLDKKFKLNGVGFDFRAKWSNILYVTGHELNTLRKFCTPKNSKLEPWEFLKYSVKNSCNILCKKSPGKIIRAYNAAKLEEIGCVG
jgi:hypothetical protein